ncbi:MAG: autotransporter outer membrane beta-barrel domain-containing protein [Hyphomicrobiales bacterium]|nr:autotransporter outer membrane beta-barrel domain-containing protein [Hyphomicrobiales bacterium]
MKTIVKGGHLRKTASGIISFAPFMATASTVALGALLATASPAEAGTCDPVPNTTGEYVCSGGSSPSDGTQNIMVGAGETLTVTDGEAAGQAAFGLDVTSAGSNPGGIDVTTTSTSGDISLTLGSGRLSSDGDTIKIYQEGTGSVYVRTEGSVISNNEAGFNISTAAATTGDVTILMNGTVLTEAAGGDGINVNHGGSGTLTITTNGTVVSGNGNGIEVTAASGGSINVNNDVTTSASDKASILISNTGMELVTINLNDGVTVSGGSTTALSLASVHSNSDIRVSIGDGVSLGGGTIAGGGVNGVLIIGLRGTATGTGDDDDANNFDIGLLEGGDVIEKTGSGTWTVMGTPGANAPFSSTARIDVDGGRLIWDATSEFNGESVSVNGPGILEIDSARTWGTDVTLSGRLALTGASSSLDLNGELASNGGEIDIDVDFSGGDQALQVARVDVSEVSGGSVTVNVRAIDGFPEISEDDEDGLISIENFIRAATANADFRAGRALSGDFAFRLVPVEDGQGRQWTLAAGLAPAGGTVHDTFVAVLTQLSQSGMLHERLLNRQLKYNTNVYAKPVTSTLEVEPFEASAFESKTHGVRFGVHAPLLKLFREPWANNVNFDASVEYVQDETEAMVEVGSVEMKTEAIAAALGATWERDSTFIDGHVRFANFESDFEYGEETPADPNATSLAASVEIGYAFENGSLSLDEILGADFVDDVFPGLGDAEVGFDDISLVPSLQISWSGVDYNDYVSTEGTNVRLYDGNTVFGRAGISAQGDWSNFALQGRLSVVVPIDGEVITQVNGVNVPSERKEIAFDVGLGAAYSWGDYALTLDASTQQGDEVEGYGGSVGLKYNF